MIHTFTQTGCAHYVRLYLVEKTPLYRNGCTTVCLQALE